MKRLHPVHWCLLGAILFLAVFSGGKASAEYKQRYEGYTYSVLLNDTLIINEYSGGYEEELVIPGMIDGRRVTQIGFGGFNSCKAHHIVVPDGVTFIGYDGFIYATMESIEIPASVTFVDEKAFVYCDYLNTIYCPKGSYAEKWAKNNGYAVEYKGDEVTGQVEEEERTIPDKEAISASSDVNDLFGTWKVDLEAASEQMSTGDAIIVQIASRLAGYEAEMTFSESSVVLKAIDLIHEEHTESFECRTEGDQITFEDGNPVFWRVSDDRSELYIYDGSGAAMRLTRLTESDGSAFRRDETAGENEIPVELRGEWKLRGAEVRDRQSQEYVATLDGGTMTVTADQIRFKDNSFDIHGDMQENINCENDLLYSDLGRVIRWKLSNDGQTITLIDNMNLVWSAERYGGEGGKLPKAPERPQMKDPQLIGEWTMIQGWDKYQDEAIAEKLLSGADDYIEIIIDGETMIYRPNEDSGMTEQEFTYECFGNGELQLYQDGYPSLNDPYKVTGDLLEYQYSVFARKGTDAETEGKARLRRLAEEKTPEPTAEPTPEPTPETTQEPKATPLPDDVPQWYRLLGTWQNTESRRYAQIASELVITKESWTMDGKTYPVLYAEQDAEVYAEKQDSHLVSVQNMSGGEWEIYTWYIDEELKLNLKPAGFFKRATGEVESVHYDYEFDFPPNYSQFTKTSGQVIPSAVPTMTPEPTPEPTLEPTPEPTPEPTETPTATPSEYIYSIYQLPRARDDDMSKHIGIVYSEYGTSNMAVHDYSTSRHYKIVDRIRRYEGQAIYSGNHMNFNWHRLIDVDDYSLYLAEDGEYIPTEVSIPWTGGSSYGDKVSYNIRFEDIFLAIAEARGEDIETVKAYQDKQAEENAHYWSHLTFKVTGHTKDGEIPFFYLTFIPNDYAMKKQAENATPSPTPAPTPTPTPSRQITLGGALPADNALVQMNEDATVGFTLKLNDDGTATLDEGYPEGYFNYYGTWSYENNQLILKMDDTATALEQTIRIKDGKAIFVYFGVSIPKELTAEEMAFLSGEERAEDHSDKGGTDETAQKEPAPEPVQEPTTAPTPEPTTAPTPEPAPEPEEIEDGLYAIPIAKVDADSWIVGENPDEFVPEKMIDGDEETAWQFSTKESKIKETYVHFYFDQPVSVEQLWIKNGFWAMTDGKDQYKRNSRVKGLGIAFQYEGSEEWTDKKTYNLKDDAKKKDWQKVDFGKREHVTGIRFRIMSIYTGSKFKNDVSISEVMFVSHEKPVISKPEVPEENTFLNDALAEEPSEAETTEADDVFAEEKPASETNEGGTNQSEESKSQTGDFEFGDDENGIYSVLKYTGKEKTVTIPSVDPAGNPVTNIARMLFAEERIISEKSRSYSSSDVERVTISEGIESICNSAFYFCTELKEIQIPETVTFIDRGAFQSCYELETFIWPENVKTIPWTCFHGCKKLKNITIPESVNAIGYGAFKECESLESIVLPDSIQSFENSVFAECTHLKSVKLPDNITKIPDYFFEECTDLMDIIMPSNIQEIGWDSFAKCESLVSMEFPNTIRIISSEAFKDCKNLTIVKIPEEVEEMGNDVFSGCDNLKEIYAVPGSYAWNWCAQNGLTTLLVPWDGQ